MKRLAKLLRIKSEELEGKRETNHVISGNRQNRNRVDLSEDQNPRSHVQNDLGSPSLAFNIISTCFAKTKQGS